MGVLPRLRPLAPPRDRLARSARARRRAPRHGRRRGVGLDRRARARLVRPPDHRDDAACVRAARHPSPRGVERGGLRTDAGERSARGSASASGAPSTSSTGRRSSASFEQLVDLLRDVSTGSRRRAARDDHHSRAATSTRRIVAEVDLGPKARPEPRLPGRLLAVPESAHAVRASRRQGDRLAPRGSCVLRCSRARAGVPAVLGDLALRRRPDVRQLDRRARARRGSGDRHHLPGGAAGALEPARHARARAHVRSSAARGRSRASRRAIETIATTPNQKSGELRELMEAEVDVHAHDAGDQRARQQQDRRQREDLHDLVRAVLRAEDQQVERADDGILGVPPGGEGVVDLLR